LAEFSAGASAFLPFHCFAVDDHPTLVGADGIKGLCPGGVLVQVGSVLQSKHVGVNDIPQFVAQGRAQVLHNEFLPSPKIAATAIAFGDGELDLWHSFVLLWGLKRSSILFQKFPDGGAAEIVGANLVGVDG